MTTPRPWSRRSVVTLFAAGLVSRLVAAQSAAQDSGRSATPETGAGPEYRAGAPSMTRLWREGDPGTRLHLRGRVLGSNGRPVEGARIELWQADGAGSYQPERYRGSFGTGRGGEFAVDTAVPGQYWGTKHIHLIVRHAAHQPLSTRILFKGDPNLDPADEALAILLEAVNKDGKTVMVGNVELVLSPPGGG